MSRLPERVEGDGLLLRRWLVSDAERQHQAIIESAAHLRPWMSWMAGEPLELEARRAMIRRWEQEWADGGDVYLAVFVDGEVAGSAGLHRRRGSDTLEIGYWTHVSRLRQGIATKVAALLTDSALAVAGVARVEIRHDKANVASSGVPRRLGYRYEGEQVDGIQAPAEMGVECIWSIDRDAWAGRGKREAAER
jgi:ribosomal-protein-serine acetyltransferase